MLINDLFRKDIARSINGVVKADQLDNASIWQELDEYVVTRELDQHLRQINLMVIAGGYAVVVLLEMQVDHEAEALKISNKCS